MYKNVITIIIWVIFLYIVYVFWLTLGILTAVIILLMVVFFSFISLYLNQRIYKKPFWIDRSTIYPWIIIGIITVFAFYFHSITYNYVLQSDTKTIVFQSMNHIGTQKYYETIYQDIVWYKEKGFTYVFEGIKQEPNDTGTVGELDIIFEWNDSIKNTFFIAENDSELQKLFLDSENKNIDLSYQEIQELYMKNNTKKSIWKNNTTRSIFYKIDQSIWKYKQKYMTKVDAYVTRSLYNMFYMFLEGQQREIEKDSLDEILIYTRNQNLIEKTQQYEKLYISYWANHFWDFYDRLKKQDSSWKIIQTKETFPYLFSQ